MLVLFLREGETMDYIDLATQFLENLFKLKRHGHQKKFNECMQGEAMAILYILRRKNIVMPSDISNDMKISSARVAAMLNSLESKGYITRQMDKSDRRKILVDLTQEGKELAEKHSKAIAVHTAHMLETLGEHDALELVRIVKKLANINSKAITDN